MDIKERNELIRVDRINGMSYQEIQNKYNISETQVHRILKSLGITGLGIKKPRPKTKQYIPKKTLSEIKSEISERTLKIYDLRREGYSQKKISELLEISLTTVSESIRKSNEPEIRFTAKHNDLKYRDELIIRDRKSGMTVHELAIKYNMSDGGIGHVVRNAGLGGAVRHGTHDPEKSRTYKNPEFINQQLIKISDKVRSRLEGFQFSGNLQNGGQDNMSYDIIHNSCGTVQHVQDQAVRRGKYECCFCKSERIKLNSQKKEEEKELIRKEKEKKRIEMKLIREESKRLEYESGFIDKECPVCGSSFRTRDSKRICCSDECRRKRNNHNHDINRRLKIKENLVDKDITLEGLFRRDKGFCHICGFMCDMSDYERKDDLFIAGDYYPSIDHVIALANGGKHSWENVKLAHRICNSIKSNNDFSKEESCYG